MKHSQEKVRQAAVAGHFYPADAVKLREMINNMLHLAETASLSTAVPKAMIAPHAGYIYSGPIAASAYVLLKPRRDIIRRVVLLGPAHRVPLEGLGMSSADFFATPLGPIPVDRAALESIKNLPQVQLLDEAHRQEHSLEVHLPFLQTVLNDFSLVPLVVGDATPLEVAEVLDRLWGGDETLVVISSDLSHYQNYQTAQQMDRATSDAIEALQEDRIADDQACGRVPVSGLLHLAKFKGLHAKTIDLRNSGDTAGPRSEVVGYGAYIFR